MEEFANLIELTSGTEDKAVSIMLCSGTLSSTFWYNFLKFSWLNTINHTATAWFQELMQPLQHSQYYILTA